LPWWLVFTMLSSVPVIVVALAVQGSRSVGNSAICFVMCGLVLARRKMLWLLPVVVLGVWGYGFYSLRVQCGKAGLPTPLFENGSGRSEIWAAGLAAFNRSGLVHMLFGWGLGGSYEVIGLQMYDYSKSAHSMFFSMLLDGGVIGISAPYCIRRPNCIRVRIGPGRGAGLVTYFASLLHNARRVSRYAT